MQLQVVRALGLSESEARRKSAAKRWAKPAGGAKVSKRGRKRRLSAAASVLLAEELVRADPDHGRSKSLHNRRAEKAACAKAPCEDSFLARLTCTK